MGFFGSIVGAAVDVVITPIAIVKDVANIVQDKETDATKKHIDGITDKLEDAGNELSK